MNHNLFVFYIYTPTNHVAHALFHALILCVWLHLSPFRSYIDLLLDYLINHKGEQTLDYETDAPFARGVNLSFWAYGQPRREDTGNSSLDIFLAARL